LAGLKGRQTLSVLHCGDPAGILPPCRSALDGGRIVEQGSHDDLLRHSGRYADFWNMSMTPAASE
jgi:hypothetical protein